MLDGQPRAALVVGDQRQRAVVVGLACRHRSTGRPGGQRADRRPLVGAAAGDHEAIDALAEQLVDMLPLARRIVGGVAHEDRDALVGELLLERLDDRQREPAEGVVGDDARPSSSACGAGSAPDRWAGSRCSRAAASTLSRVSCRQPAAVVERLAGGADRHARPAAPRRGWSATVRLRAGRCVVASSFGHPRSALDRAGHEAAHVVALQQQEQDDAGHRHHHHAGLASRRSR